MNILLICSYQLSPFLVFLYSDLQKTYRSLPQINAFHYSLLRNDFILVCSCILQIFPSICRNVFASHRIAVHILQGAFASSSTFTGSRFRPLQQSIFFFTVHSTAVLVFCLLFFSQLDLVNRSFLVLPASIIDVGHTFKLFINKLNQKIS